MDTFSEIGLQRLRSYLSHSSAVLTQRLGFGLDGIVYQTDRQSAVKVFEREASYLTELEVYRRLRDADVMHIQGHTVPQLLDFDNVLRVIEMSIVQTPYLLDFAKATLDHPPDFPEEVMQQWREERADLFEDRWPEVVGVMRELERRLGVYLTDIHPGNITFEDR